MFTSRLSKYTFAELDDLLKFHPRLQTLSRTERREIYNEAQKQVMANYENIHQIQNSGIVNNRYTYTSGTQDDKTLTLPSASDLENLRASTTLFSLLDLTVGKRSVFDNLPKDTRKSIYNAAQNAINELYNQSDNTKFVLWYPEGAETTYTYQNFELSLNTSFSVSIVEVYEEAKELPLLTSYTLEKGGIANNRDIELDLPTSYLIEVGDVQIDYIKELPLTTSFSLDLDEVAVVRQFTKDLPLTTSYELSVAGQNDVSLELPLTTSFVVVAPTQHTETMELSLSTSFNLSVT